MIDEGFCFARALGDAEDVREEFLNDHQMRGAAEVR